jgi:hypothetical protein
MIDLVLVWDPLAAVDVNGNQMATWSYKRGSLTASDTSALASEAGTSLQAEWPRRIYEKLCQGDFVF